MESAVSFHCIAYVFGSDLDAGQDITELPNLSHDLSAALSIGLVGSSK